MNRSPRPGLLLLLLLLVAGFATTVRADTVTYHVTMNWPTYLSPSTTYGQFTLTRNTTGTSFPLDSWTMNTPQLGVFQDGPAESGIAMIPIVGCSGQCFEIVFRKPWNYLKKSSLTLFFDGDINTWDGGPIAKFVIDPNDKLLYSQALCIDPCRDQVTGFVTRLQTPEPSGLLLLGAGLLSGAFARGWRRRQRN